MVEYEAISIQRKFTIKWNKRVPNNKYRHFLDTSGYRQEIKLRRIMIHTDSQYGSMSI